LVPAGCKSVVGREPNDTSSEEYVKQLVAAPGDWRVESVIAIGYPAEQRQPRPAEELDYGKVMTNKV